MAQHISQRTTRHIVVIGAGIGGLTTAALLAKAGLCVTVLEAHVYPGGCAGTFYHQGYRFDAGATVAGGFYPGGPMSKLAKALDFVPIKSMPDGTPGNLASGNLATNKLAMRDFEKHVPPTCTAAHWEAAQWDAVPSDIAMAVHLPLHITDGDHTPIIRYGDQRRWAERRRAFGETSLPFWAWQETTADLLWDLALRLPPWPPQTPRELGKLVHRGTAWGLSHWQKVLNPGWTRQAFQPVAARLHEADDKLRLFVDGQLLIAAQVTSHAANAFYGASALDLPRRGIVHPQRGMGSLAEKLVQTIRRYGGEVHFRKQVTSIRTAQGRPVAVRTRRNEEYPADAVIANLTPWNIAQLLDADLPAGLRGLPKTPDHGWGAFTLYAGIDASVLGTSGLASGQVLADSASHHSASHHSVLHHQVIVQEPLGEGNSVFVSISPAQDETRAPQGKRAVTISTHTGLNPWWTLYHRDRSAYEARRATYAQRVLDAVEQAIPGFRAATELLLPATPVTFNRFTRRAHGWVGGFPQTSLLRSWGPSIGKNIWMVGDSIFPGQSIAAVALGGMRVADAILSE